MATKENFFEKAIEVLKVAVPIFLLALTGQAAWALYTNEKISLRKAISVILMTFVISALVGLWCNNENVMPIKAVLIGSFVGLFSQSIFLILFSQVTMKGVLGYFLKKNVGWLYEWFYKDGK